MISIVVRNEELRAHACRQIAGLSLEKLWEVTVKPYRKTRSPSQNNLMWVWLEEGGDHVREHTGMDKDDIHDFFKDKFCPVSTITLGGEVAERKTTTTLDTAQMSRYMEDIRSWCFTTLGISLSAPPSES